MYDAKHKEQRFLIFSILRSICCINFCSLRLSAHICAFLRSAACALDPFCAAFHFQSLLIVNLTTSAAGSWITTKSLVRRHNAFSYMVCLLLMKMIIRVLPITILFYVCSVRRYAEHYANGTLHISLWFRKRIDEIAVPRVNRRVSEWVWRQQREREITFSNRFIFKSFFGHLSEAAFFTPACVCARSFLCRWQCISLCASGHYFIDRKLLFQQIRWRTAGRMQTYADGFIPSRCTLYTEKSWRCDAIASWFKLTVETYSYWRLE